MTWFKVDDGFYSHPKVVYLKTHHPRVFGNAIALWTLAGSYASKHGTDGLVDPKAFLHVFKVRSMWSAVDALVASKLWSADTQVVGCYRIHDFLDYNPSASEVADKAKEHADRQAAYRERQCAKRDASRVTPRDAAPVPSRPDQNTLTKTWGDPPTPFEQKGQEAKNGFDEEGNPRPAPKVSPARIGRLFRDAFEAKRPDAGAWMYYDKFQRDFKIIADNTESDEQAKEAISRYFSSTNPFVIKRDYSPSLLAQDWPSYKAPPANVAESKTEQPTDPALWVFDPNNEPPSKHPMHDRWITLENERIMRACSGNS